MFSTRDVLMSSIMLSVNPKWCRLIETGKKKIEVRKNLPIHRWSFPITVYIYETIAGNKSPSKGKVIGKFTCRNIYEWNYINSSYDITENELQETSLSYTELADYGQGKTLYGIEISDYVKFDEPKDLCNFYFPCRTPEMPYCPICKYGYVEIPDEESYRTDGGGYTIWRCRNSIKKAPQSWCYCGGGIY